jgi:hypothetical protein
VPPNVVLNRWALCSGEEPPMRGSGEAQTVNGRETNQRMSDWAVGLREAPPVSHLSFRGDGICRRGAIYPMYSWAVIANPCEAGRLW